MTTSFRSARLLAPGWDDDLVLEQTEALPEPQRGQVRIRVKACGIAYRDVIDRSGRVPFMRFPMTPGHEIAGVVDAIDTGSDGEPSEWAVGDKVATMHRDHCGVCAACEAGETSLCRDAFWVFGLLADGGFASHVIAPDRSLYRLPDDAGAGGLSMAQCAVLLSAWGTAWRGLHKFGSVKAGDRVLVTGANGGVGSGAVRLAKALGAQVTAVVRDAKYEAFVREQGAARVVVSEPTGRFDCGAWEADLGLDCVGAATFNSVLRALRLGGNMVAIGNIDEQRVSLSVGKVILGGVTIAGSTGATRADMAGLLAFIGEHGLRPPIEDELPLAQADAGMRRVRAGGLRGRIVLKP